MHTRYYKSFHVSSVVIRPDKTAHLFHELSREVRPPERRSPGTLLQVRAGSVSAFGVLVIEIRHVHRGELRRELAGVLRSHPVVLGVGPDERLRIGHAALEILVRRGLLPEGADLRIADAAVLAHPRRAGLDLL